MKTIRDLPIVRAGKPVTTRGAGMDSDDDPNELEDEEIGKKKDKDKDDKREDSDVLGTMYGYFSVFDNWYPVSSWWEGSFIERIAPGAFTKTISERFDRIVVAFDHGMDPTIGDKVLGKPDIMTEDSIGAYYEVSLLDTSYNRDLMPALKRGLYSASFRFQVIREEWNFDPDPSPWNPDGADERTIKEVKLFEFGPVTYPANPAASAGMRSETDNYYQRLRSVKPEYVARLASEIETLRTSKSGADRHSITLDKDAAQSPIAPTDGHPMGMSREARARMLTLLSA